MLPFTLAHLSAHPAKPNPCESAVGECPSDLELRWSDPVDEWTHSNLGIGYAGGAKRVLFDREDIRAVLRLEQVELCPAEFERFYRELDRDRDGFVSLREYAFIPKILKILLAG